MKRTLASLPFFLTFLCLNAQDTGENKVGVNHFLDSEKLGEKRQIQVYLPPDYSDTEGSYPVLYVLDGQQFFNHAVSLNTTFRQFDLTPDFIIVGITTSYPQRYRHFSSGMDQFIEFMSTELVPFIESTYRANQQKLLFGWQYAGGLGFNILTSDAIPFNGYLLASPFPIEGQVDELGNSSTLNKTLCFSVSPDEYSANHGTDKLDSLLSTVEISELDWSYLKLENEEHHSTGYATL